MALNITAARPDPALLDLPWELPLETWPEEHLAALPRGISRHVVRFVKLSGRVLAVKEIKADIAAREYQMLRMLQPARPALRRAVRHRQRPRRHRRRAARRLPHHPAPAVLAALPRAVQPVAAPGHLDPADRRPRRAAGPPAPRRVLVGRRVAVEHAVPARRRRVRGIPRRRRDRRAAPDAHRRPARARPRHRPGQHRRRADGPRGRRLPRGGRRPGRHVEPHRHPLRRAVGRAHRPRAVRARRPVARRRADPPPQRARLRRRRARHLDRLRRHARSRSSPRSSTPATTRADCCGSPASTSRRTRPAGCSTTSTPTAPAPTGRTTTRRSSRTTGWPGSTSRSPAPCPRELAGKLEPAELFHEVLEHRWYLSERAGHDMPIEDAIRDYVDDGPAEQARRGDRGRRRHRGDAGRRDVRRPADDDPRPSPDPGLATLG